ncbi:ABC transporter substrate-binding protein [Streptomyces sp. NPDC050560]|uniref:ABC transporter substrate-binding protein n=1 Tax=Streptomyces sp. NPDC050560 TaxID=3365630 RepID=UPI0037AF8CBA
MPLPHPRDVSRRTLLRSAAAGAGLAATAGCMTPSESDAVTLLDWETVPGTPLGDALEAFERKTGIHVDVQPTPTSDYDTKLRTVMSSGVPPDVVRMNDDFVRGYSAGGQLLDLNPYIKQDGLRQEDYFERAWRFPVQPNGEHTALCVGTQPCVIFYNVDAFKEAGVPLPPTTWTDKGWTWDDFLATAKKLTVPGKRWGVLMYDDTSAETTCTVNNGDPTGIYSADGKRFTLASPQGVDGIQWLADLTNKHHVQVPWSRLQPDSTTNFDDSLFVQGKVAMVSRAYGIAPYYSQNVKDFTWDIAPIPGNRGQTTISTMIVWALPKQGRNHHQAWQLLKFLSEGQGAEILARQHNYVPANREVARGLKSNGRPPAHLGLLSEAIEHATNENVSPNVDRARTIYRPQLQQVWLGQKTAAEVLGSVESRVNKALSGKF